MSIINKNAELSESVMVDDYRDENIHAISRDVCKSVNILEDLLFCPVYNFHTYQYRSINDRWG